jgi:hypothetical protein
VSVTLDEKNFRNTDKHVAAQLKRSPAVTRLGTQVLSRLCDLSDLLPDLIASRRPTTL